MIICSYYHIIVILNIKFSPCIFELHCTATECVLLQEPEHIILSFTFLQTYFMRSEIIYTFIIS